MKVPVGSVCHVELFAIDLDEAAAFYMGLFGWETEPHDAGYRFWTDQNGFTGGFTTAGGPVINPAATFYVKVESINKTLAKIRTLGGTIIREKIEIGNNRGFYALFRDPSGNNVGLWSSD